MITITDISIDDFKNYFVRDFSYAIPAGQTESIYTCQKDYVMDSDIQKAFDEAAFNFNESLFSTDNSLKIAFLYLTAHYLVNDLQTSQQGLAGNGYFPVNSRAVGGVSESYHIPDWMLNDPIFGHFATTRYGQKYISLIKPLLIGNIAVYEGATTYN